MDLTGALAQIFIIWWGKEFKWLLQELQLKVIMMRCYVGDINWEIPVVALGTRYVDGTLVIEDVLVLHDEALPEDLRTMLLYKSVGNSIHSSIQLEIDCPSNHDDQKMPILDLRVWMEALDDQGSRVMHEFYMKSVSL